MYGKDRSRSFDRWITSKQYGLVVASGKAWTTDQIESMDEEEAEKRYARYEARLGAAMTKTLGEATLKLYAKAANIFLPIPTCELKIGTFSEIYAQRPLCGYCIRVCITGTV